MRIAIPIAFSSLASALLLACSVAVPVHVTYADDADEGFNDPALGPARRAAFEAALGQWSEALSGSVPILVKATFDPKGGTASSAVLGSAGAYKVLQNFMGAPYANTWYPSALGSNIAGIDYYPGTPMIVAIFNSDIDNPTVLGDRNWYYGTDGYPGDNVDFYQVALHELAHGLGFFSFLAKDGTWLVMGGMYQPGVYDRFLASGPETTSPRLVAMSADERAAAAVSSELYFVGPRCVATNSGLGAEIYAPGSFSAGSSISHLDQGAFQYTASALMCPKYVTLTHSPGPVAEAILRDLGWTVNGGYTAADAVLALRAAAGFEALSPIEATHLNVVTDRTSPPVVDFADAQALARKAAGVEP